MSETSLEQRASGFDSDIEKGLTDKQAKINRKKYGYNNMIDRIPVPAFTQIKKAVKGINFIALVVSIFLAFIAQSEYDNPNDKFKCFLVPMLAMFIILFKIILSIFTSTLSYRVDRSYTQKQQPIYPVTRNGKITSVALENVVVGDILILEKGMYSPAVVEIISTGNGPFMYEEIDQSSVPSVTESRSGIIPAGAYLIAGEAKCLVTETVLVSAFAKTVSSKNMKFSLLYYMVIVLAIAAGCANLVISIVTGPSDNTKMNELFASIVSLLLAAAPDATFNAIWNAKAVARKHANHDSMVFSSENVIEDLDKISTLVISHHGGINTSPLEISSFQYVEKGQLVSSSNYRIEDKNLVIISFGDYAFNSDSVIDNIGEDFEVISSGSMSPTEYFLNESTASRSLNQSLKAKLMYNEQTVLRLGKPYAILASGKDLSFVAGITFEDPFMKGILRLVEASKLHGIRILLCSSDNEEATSGIANKLRHSTKSSIVDGKEWNSMSDKEKKKAALKNSAFSSFDAEKRSDIIQILEENGEKVGLLYGIPEDIPASRKCTLTLSSKASVPCDIQFKTDYKPSFDLFAHVASNITTRTRLIVYMLEIVISLISFSVLSNAFGIKNGLNQQNMLLISIFTQTVPLFLSRIAYSPRHIVRMNTIQFIRSVSVGIVASISSVAAAIAVQYFDVSAQKIPEEYIGTITVASLALCHVFIAILNVDAKNSVVAQVFLKNFWITFISLVNTTLLALSILAPHIQDAFGFVYLDPQYWLLVLASVVPVIFVDEVFKFVIRFTSGFKSF